MVIADFSRFRKDSVENFEPYGYVRLQQLVLIPA